MTGCPLHPKQALTCPACIGSQGGRKMTPKQLARNRRAARRQRKPKAAREVTP